MATTLPDFKLNLDPVEIWYGPPLKWFKYRDNACNCDTHDMEIKEKDILYPRISQKRTDNNPIEIAYEFSVICCQNQLDVLLAQYLKTPHILDMSNFEPKPSPIDLTKFLTARWGKIVDPKNKIEEYQRFKSKEKSITTK